LLPRIDEVLEPTVGHPLSKDIGDATVVIRHVAVDEVHLPHESPMLGVK